MRPYRFGVLVLILTWWSVSTVGQTTSNGESRTSWTFDTYTPVRVLRPERDTAAAILANRSESP